MSTRNTRRRKQVEEPADDSHKDKKLKLSESTATKATKKRGRPKKHPKNETEVVQNGEQLAEPDTHSKHMHSHAPRTLETGHISFFYRPKVELEDASSIDEVQKLYMVLRPDEEDGKKKHGGINRLVLLTKKHLPEVDTHERNWGFVDLVSHNVEDISNRLGASTYETKTLGTRHQYEAKPCGHGVYSIVHHTAESKSKDHTHLAYVLELPESPGEMQNEFNIKKEASFIIISKNPHTENPPQAGLQEDAKADYPKKVQEDFHGKKFIPVDDLKLLDYQGAELIFIGAAKEEEVAHELGECAKTIEKIAKKEEAEEHRHPETFLDSALFKGAEGKLPEEVITETWHAAH